MKVDLFATSRKLEDLMIRKYSGFIFENQHYVDKSDSEQKVYCFYNLNYSELFRFLPRCKKYEYEIRDKEGKIIEINKLENEISQI